MDELKGEEQPRVRAEGVSKRASSRRSSKGSVSKKSKKKKRRSKDRKRRMATDDFMDIVLQGVAIFLVGLVSWRFLRSSSSGVIASSNYERTPVSNYAKIDADTEAGIIGGEEAPVNRYNFAANLVTLDEEGKALVFCGASLIHKNWVLTAAHCVVDNEGIPETNRTKSIWIGRHDLNEEEKFESFKVDQLIVHPGFDLGTINNDFALIKLSGESNIQPVIVDDGSGKPARILKALGWGLASGPPLVFRFSTLMEANLYVVSSKICNILWKLTPYELEITKSMICASSSDKTTYKGDSGGPAIIPSRCGKSDVLVGVVSFGSPYGLHRYLPDVFARASEAREWIEENIGEALPIPDDASCPLVTRRLFGASLILLPVIAIYMNKNVNAFGNNRPPAGAVMEVANHNREVEANRREEEHRLEEVERQQAEQLRAEEEDI